MERLELLVSKVVNVIEEEYDKARLDKNVSEDWVFVLENLLKYLNESDNNTSLGAWTLIITMLTTEYHMYKSKENITNKIEELESKIIRVATSLGF